jgi:ribosome-associated protein
MKKNKKIKLDDESPEEAVISKTQLKNEAKELFQFGKELIELSPAKLKLLPFNETTQIAISDYYKQTGNIAKKRHLLYLGKCLRHDNVVEAKRIILDDSFAQLRALAAVTSKSETKAKKQDFIEVLLVEGDKQIQKLVEQYPDLNVQMIRQLLRNVQNAKTEQKKTQATSKLKIFITDNKIAIE